MESIALWLVMFRISMGATLVGIYGDRKWEEILICGRMGVIIGACSILGGLIFM